MVALVSAVISVFGAIATVAAGYRVQAQARSRERLDHMGLYRDALLWAAFDLQSRIYNILRGFTTDRHTSQRGFTSAFLLGGSEAQAQYVRTSTAFLFAEYLGWMEIFRRDLRFLDLGDSELNRRVMLLTSRVSNTLNAATTADAECFRIFRADQRAIGELMIDPKGGPGDRSCIGYATFCAAMAAGAPLAGWIQGLMDHVDTAARHPAQAEARLTALQHQLIDLIDALDPKRQRFPSEQRGRFEMPPPAPNPG